MKNFTLYLQRFKVLSITLNRETFIKLVTLFMISVMATLLVGTSVHTYIHSTHSCEHSSDSCSGKRQDMSVHHRSMRDMDGRISHLPYR